MPKRPRRKPERNENGRRGRALSAQNAGDRFLLDAFTALDIEDWQKTGAAVTEYEVRRYHELETLRQLYKDELIAALAPVEARSIELDRWCRIVDYRYGDNPLSATGSFKRGGRFNIGRDCDRCSAERFPALYLAEDHATAITEKFGAANKAAGLTGSDFALRDTQSYSYVRVSGRLERVFALDRLAEGAR